MSYGPDLQKIILLAVGCYLFSTMAHMQTSHARSHGMLELAMEKLSHVDLRAIPVAGSEQDPSVAALMMQP